MPVDGRADIFSLGVMLYEMLTNKRPFAGDSIPTVIYKIIGFHPDPPSVANPNLHPGLNVVLTKVLAKDPESRYQTCADLLKDLKRYQSLQGPPEAMAMPFTGTPSIVRTLAPPMVDGTVALDNK